MDQKEDLQHEVKPEQELRQGENISNIQDFSDFVQNLLQQMQKNIETISDQVLQRIDEMGGRIDQLERSINDLVSQTGVDPTDQQK